jgi:hypothetical protein
MHPLRSGGDLLDRDACRPGDTDRRHALTGSVSP